MRIVSPVKKLATFVFGTAFNATMVLAQPFDSGSDGSYGPLECTSENCVFDVPADGIFNCTTITIENATLTFNRNALNTPVYLLATGDITFTSASINVSGSNGTPAIGGLAGPGGFDGGNPGLGTLVPPSDGYGPGAGRAGENGFTGPDQAAGAGSFGTLPHSSVLSPNDGARYGSPMSVPLIGGSGGGGTTGEPGIGGGGGGGAILLASNTRIHLTSVVIRADGGRGSASALNDGSGGAIRLVAPVIAKGGGSIQLLVYGGGGSPLWCSPPGCGGAGRIRIDTTGPPPPFSFAPSGVVSIGSFMRVFPTPRPSLDIIHAAGQDIPEDQPEPVIVELPFGSPSTQPVTVRARNFTGIVPIEVVVTPEHGDGTVYPAQIDMTGIALGDPGEVTVNVEIPPNTPVRLHAWNR